MGKDEESVLGLSSPSTEYVLDGSFSGSHLGISHLPKCLPISVQTNVALGGFAPTTKESILYLLLAWWEIGQKPSKIVTWLADSTYLTESEDGRILFQAAVAFAADDPPSQQPQISWT